MLCPKLQSKGQQQWSNPWGCAVCYGSKWLCPPKSPLALLKSCKAPALWCERPRCVGVLLMVGSKAAAGSVGLWGSGPDGQQHQLALIPMGESLAGGAPSEGPVPLSTLAMRCCDAAGFPRGTAVLSCYPQLGFEGARKGEASPCSGLGAEVHFAVRCREDKAPSSWTFAAARCRQVL